MEMVLLMLLLPLLVKLLRFSIYSLQCRDKTQFVFVQQQKEIQKLNTVKRKSYPCHINTMNRDWLHRINACNSTVHIHYTTLELLALCRMLSVH